VRNPGIFLNNINNNKKFKFDLIYLFLAAICGCIGYKPTYGLISRYGLIPLNNYFDTVGIMANSIDTITNVLSKNRNIFLK
jgi:hypothetical protein